MLIEKLRARRELLVLIALGLATLWIWSRALRNETPELTAVFLDVGQGDCIFIRTPSGRTMLVDGGGRSGDSEGDHIGMSVVEPYLRRLGTNRIDLVVLTHPHDDHVQGLVPVVRDFRIGMVLDPGISHGADSYARFLATVQDRRIPYRRLVRGQRIDFGDGVSAQVLNPTIESVDNNDADANDLSAVIRIVYGKHAIMLTGDASSETEEDIISSGVALESDILKVSHHGSRTSTCDEWLSVVRPRYAVISVGRGNPFSHPSTQTLQRLSTHGVRVLRTDECGAVTARLRGSGVYVQTCLPGNAD